MTLALVLSLSLLGAPPQAPPQAPPPSLDLPPPPAMAVTTIESSPPGARIRDTLRVDPFEPWLLGGVGLSRRLTSPSSFGGLIDVRGALPILLYGAGRTGVGLAPIVGGAGVSSFPWHVTAGAAVGLLERRLRFSHGPRAIVYVPEAILPLSRAEGQGTGFRHALMLLSDEVYGALVHAWMPMDGGSRHVIVLSLGLNFAEGLFR